MRVDARLWISAVLCTVLSLCAAVAAHERAAEELRFSGQAHTQHSEGEDKGESREPLAGAGAGAGTVSKGVTLKRGAFDGLGPVPQSLQVDPQLDFLNGESWDPRLWDELWERREIEIHRQVAALQQQRQGIKTQQNANSERTRNPNSTVTGSAATAIEGKGAGAGAGEREGGRSLQGCSLAAFTAWKDSAYEGILLSDPQFWRYQTQLQFVLSKGLALELAVAKCANRFKLLQNFKSGKGGPIDIQNVWKAMCTDECMQSDVMHQEAMAASDCSCLELSTQENEPSYRVPGDWCLHNSARMLCDKLGFCGVWGCRIDDFMCPRYEWNKKTIAYKGPGHCDRKANAASSAYVLNVYVPAVSLLAAALVLWGGT